MQISTKGILASFLAGSMMLAGSVGLNASSGSALHSGASTNDVLHLAYFQDMSSPDPDIFYDVEGNTVTQSLYDGLLQYRPNTTQIVGQLATSYGVSTNGLRYTFHLRSGVKFASGASMSSQSVKASFLRRTAVNQGPAYMLADVARYLTPNRATFVVVLKKPVSAFVSYLASTWGPKIVGPSALVTHSGKDHGQTWLKTHSDGSGPYSLASFQRGQKYTLARNSHYWGHKPFFRQVQIKILPDFSSQLLRLNKGDLDVVLHGFPLADLPAVHGNNSLRVRTFSSLDTGAVYLNTHRSELKRASVRKAVILAMDVPTLIREVYGNTASVANTPYPFHLMNPAMAPVNFSYNLRVIKKALPHQLSLSLVYSQDASGVVQREADLVRQHLQAAGITVNERQVQLPVVYNYIKNLKGAPDLYLSTPAPDAANPDTWARIVWHSQGALNFFNYSNRAVDAGMDRGLHEANRVKSTADYARVGRLAAADWAVVPISYVQDVMPLQANLTNVLHYPAYPWYLDLGALKRK